MSIRPVTETDVHGIKAIIEATDMFPHELLDDMLQPYLDSSAGCSDLWLTEVAKDGTPVSIVFCAPERMTEGTWNALMLAVLPQYQSKGYGSRLLLHLERLLRDTKEARILLVETSGADSFARQREFYGRKLGYEQVAIIPEFYQANEDKVVFLKKLFKKETARGELNSTLTCGVLKRNRKLLWNDNSVLGYHADGREILPWLINLYGS